METLVDPGGQPWRLLDESGAVLMGGSASASGGVSRIIAAAYPWRLEVSGATDVQAGTGRWAILGMLALTRREKACAPQLKRITTFGVVLNWAGAPVAGQ